MLIFLQQLYLLYYLFFLVNYNAHLSLNLFLIRCFIKQSLMFIINQY